MNKGILNKYLNGDCSQEEFENFTKWILQSSLNKDSEDLVLEDWNLFEPVEGVYDHERYRSLLDKIHHEINLKERTKEREKPVSIAARWFSRAAAILFLPMLGIILFLMTNNEIRPNLTVESAVDTLEVISPIGSRSVIQLHDGTKVHLNFGSSIRYPREFIGSKREIELNGEAYFNVVHNPEKPFIVSVGKLNIKVLGTEFNVQAYPNDNKVSTTLVNGKVALEELTTGGELNSIGAMVPGQHIDYDINSGEMSSTIGDIDKYVSWKDGKLVFDNESITNVAKNLSRMYNVDIEVAENVRDLTYTVTFVDESLFFILNLMTETTPIKYTVSERQKLSDGTYSKQHIKIERR